MKYFYGRCSKDEEIQKNSIETQIDLVEKKYGKCDDYFYDIGISGAANLDKRIGLANALEVLKKDDELIVARLDRMARDTYLSSYIQLQVEKKGAKIISATEETLNGDDATSQLLKTIIQAFSSYERQMIKSRVRQTLGLKKSKSERISRFAEYGYDFAGEDSKSVVINEDEQKVLSLVKELKDDGNGITDVKKELERRKIKSKRGNDTWNYMSVRNIYHRVS
jgi:DNA invertase Pin-like site-specific DNA recombinase